MKECLQYNVICFLELNEATSLHITIEVWLFHDTWCARKIKQTYSL